MIKLAEDLGIDDNTEIYKQIETYVKTEFLVNPIIQTSIWKKLTIFKCRAWNPLVETWEEYQQEINKEVQKYKEQIEGRIKEKTKRKFEINKRAREIFLERYGFINGEVKSYRALGEKYGVSYSRIKEIIDNP